MNRIYRLCTLLTSLILLAWTPTAADAQPGPTPPSDCVVPTTGDPNYLGDADHIVLEEDQCYQIFNGALVNQGVDVNAGTGNLDPFVRIASNDLIPEGINGEAKPKLDEGNAWTDGLRMSTISESTVEGTLYKEFVLDINQSSNPGVWYPITELKIYVVDESGRLLAEMGDLNQYYAGYSAMEFQGVPAGYEPLQIFELDDPHLDDPSQTPVNRSILLDYDYEAGSGNNPDMTLRIPSETFDTEEGYCSYGDVDCDVFVYVYSRFGDVGDVPICNDNPDGYLDCEGNTANFEEWATFVRPLLEVTKQADGDLGVDIDWEITKTVDGGASASYSANVGETILPDYEVSVDQKTSIASFTVSGTITLEALTEVPSSGESIDNKLDIAIQSITDTYDGDDLTVTCPEGTAFLIDVGDMITCTFEKTYLAGDLPPSLVLNEDPFSFESPDNFATVTTEFRTYTASDDVTGDVTVDDGFEDVNVTDTHQDSPAPWGPVSDDMSWQYLGSFTCDEEATYTDGSYQITYDNTAEITETGQQATASITLDCYAPLLSKDATATYDREYQWDITKTVDGGASASYSAFVGETVTPPYEVAVDQTGFTDTNIMVTGTITVDNPNPEDDMFVQLSDELDDGTVASLDCALPLEVPAGTSETCGYTAEPADLSATSNTVTLTLDSYSDTADAGFEWSETPTNESVNVTDTHQDAPAPWGPVSDDASWQYDGSFTCSTEAEYVDGVYVIEYDNTAEITETEQQASADVTITCYAPLVSKSGDGTFTRTYEWEITKLVDGAASQSYTAFVGETVTPPYEVAVTQTGTTDSNIEVTGAITVTNPNPDAPMNGVLITDDALDGGSAITLDCGGTLDVPAGSSADCTYSASIAGETVPEAESNAATATLNGYSVESGTADIAFNETESINDEINVTDTHQDATAPWGPVSTGDSWTYDGSFTCDLQGEYVDGHYQITYQNTAEIVETEQTASADITIDCYAPLVSKDAAGSYGREYEWEITKTVDGGASASYSAFVGETVNPAYEVAVDQTGFTNSMIMVTGTITVSNPNPDEAMFVQLSDELDDGTVASLDCTLPLEVPAGGDATCDYTANPDDLAATTNTVTVSLDQYSDSYDAGFDWVEESTYESVNVTDSHQDSPAPWGPVSDDASWQYDGAFTCSTEAEYVDGVYVIEYDNTAEITETEQQASADVTITCYAPLVSKSGDGTFTREYEWEIDKTVDGGASASYSAFVGDEVTPPYGVTVTQTGTTDSNIEVTGAITVTNPNPDAPMNGVVITDAALDGGSAITLDCGGTLDVPAGSTADCTYSASIAGDTVPEAEANAATATLNGYAVDSDVVAISFTETESINDEINVTDTHVSSPAPWGPVSTGTTWEYDGSFECDLQGEYVDGHYQITYQNTAEIVETEQTASADVTIDCYAPLISKDSDAALMREYQWLIEKTVDGQDAVTYNAFIGETVTPEYEVVLTQDGFVDMGHVVSSTIVVTNPNPDDPMTASLSDVFNTGQDATGDLECDVDFVEGVLTIPEGSSATCAYENLAIDYDDQDPLLSNTATASVGGYDATVGPVSFEFEPDVSYQEVNVTDDQPSSTAPWGPTETSDSWTYPGSFTCSTEATYENGQYVIENTNTAEIVETGQSADAMVTVNCWEPSISKTADASLTRTWDWTIDKSATADFVNGGTMEVGGNEPETDPQNPTLYDPIMIAEGQTFEVDYLVTLGAESSDSGYEVTGEITVVNPNTEDALTVTLNDELDDGTGVIFGEDCDEFGEVTVPAGGSAVCSYVAYPNDAGSASNDVSFTLNGVEFADSAPIDWEENIAYVDECVTVSDTWVGSSVSGEVCAIGATSVALPTSFDYTVTFGPEELSLPEPTTDPECGFTEWPNVADFVTNDTETTGEAPWYVLTEVVCDLGCTLTQGYWKTHNPTFGGGASAKSDETWQLLDDDPDWDQDDPFYPDAYDGDAPTYYEVMWTAGKGNPYWNTGSQYIAAVLNSLNEASVPESVADAFEQAELIFAMYPASAFDLKGKQKKEVDAEVKAAYNTLKEIHSIFAAYNEGEIGPGHCDENPSTEGPGGQFTRVAGSVDAALDAEVESPVDETNVSAAVSEGGKDVAARASEGSDDERVYTEDEPYQANVDKVDPAERTEIEVQAAPVEIPTDFAVGNYPNPFNPTTTIRVAVPEAAHIRVAVYDLLGRQVTMLVDDRMSAGTHEVSFDAGSLPSGVYLVRLEHAEGAITRTMQLLK